jgi:hypothetical protein
MVSGGGGGGAAEAARLARVDEAEGFRRRELAERQINSLFGIGDFSDDRQGAYRKQGLMRAPTQDNYQQEGWIADDGMNENWGWSRGNVDDVAGFESARDAYYGGHGDMVYGARDFGENITMNQNAGLYDAARANHAGREASYDTQFNSMMDIFTSGTDSRMEDVERQHRIDLARRGLLQSSQTVDAKTARDRALIEQMADFESQSDDYRNTLRSDDQQAYQLAMSSIGDDGDYSSAVANAQRGFDAQVGRGASRANATQFRLLFQDLEDLYSLNAFRKGENAGAGNPYSGSQFNTGSPGTGTSGIISNQA